MKNKLQDHWRILFIFLGVLIMNALFYFSSWWGLVGLAPIFIGVWGRLPHYKIRLQTH